MTIARREFLIAVGGVSLASSLVNLPTAAAAQHTPAFGFSDDSVPMNAANLCPMPSGVVDAHSRYVAALDLDLSSASRKKIEALKEVARGRIANMLRVSTDELAIVRNASEANAVIVQGMPLQAGDEVLLWDQNHPSNSVAWDVRAARNGCRITRMSVATNTNSVDEVANKFVQGITPNTKVISFTHISNISGFRLPVAEICAAIRRKKRDVHIHVDGAQTWGAVDVDMSQIDCDSFSASAHKWFMGPREVGILFVRDRHIEKIWPTIVSVPWFGAADEPPKGARKFDALSQRDDAALATLDDAAALHEELTPQGIEERSTLLADYLREGLQNLGVTFVSTANPKFASSVVILKAPRENGRKLVDAIFEHSGIIVAATGGLRMSPHIYNTKTHIDRVVAAIDKSRGLLAGG